MRKRTLLTAFTALVPASATFGVRLMTADAAPISLVHPGVLVSRGQLDFGKVNAGAQPWTAVPSSICDGKVTKVLGPVTELAYNTLRSRRYLRSRRPHGTNNLLVAWEPLTHANNPAREAQS